MNQSIIHLLLLNIGIVSDAYIDNYLISKGKEVHNLMQYLIREGFFILLAIIFAHHDNEYALYSWVLSHVVYWWTFDTVLNILRFRSFAFKDLSYVSDHGIDRLQSQMPEVWFFTKLILCMLASAYFFNQGLYQI